MNARSLLPALAIGLLTARLTAQGAPRPFQATDYYRLTFGCEPRLAPDARRVAVTVTTAVEDNVWFLRTGTTGGEAFQVRGVHALPLFSPDGKSLLYGWRGAEPDSLKQQAWRSR